MFFVYEDRFFTPEIYNVVDPELNAFNFPRILGGIPTHTEDGIPIRKLYVSNLPPRTTRTDLFGVFAQYGFIKSCWIRMGERSKFNKHQRPTYAFVTFINPADAHKALEAPMHEKVLRGFTLKTFPADSWHQPVGDEDGQICWKSHSHYNRDDSNSDSRSQSGQQEVPPAPAECSDSGEPEAESGERDTEEVKEEVGQSGEESPYTVLDILNRDCWSQILAHVPIADLIRSETVSKRWRDVVQDYLHGVRTFKTSWWQHGEVMLTTAVLRRVLQRLGPTLLRLHIDHHWSALNDRTAHTIGKFCPNLEELTVMGMHTKNWNPLSYGCKQLKTLSFVSCNKLTDSSLVRLLKRDSCLESLTVANNTHVTGLFLTSSHPITLRSLAFYNCYSLQGTVLSTALANLINLRTLKIDVGPASMWKMVPSILCKLPQLEELSLMEFASVECIAPSHNQDELCEAFRHLTELKSVSLSGNIYITNAVLKQIAQTCTKLESLNVSICNSRRTFPFKGVGDEGVSAVCGACRGLRRLDVSYLSGLTDAGLRAAAACARLTHLTARGCSALTAAPFVHLLRSCHNLSKIDACGCENVSNEVVIGAMRALEETPRPLALWLGGTGAMCLLDGEEYPTHKLLSVDTTNDLSDLHFRPDFADSIFDGSSEESFDFDPPDSFNDTDDELYLSDHMDDYDYEDALFGYGMAGGDIFLF